MKSLHLKLILILVFLLVNVFFFFKTAELYTAKNAFTEEEISNSVKVIKEKGIKINEATVLNRKMVPNVIKLDFNASSSEAVASRVMRNDYGSFTIPNGYRYTNTSENLSFSHDYMIDYVYLPQNLTKELVEGKLFQTNSTEEKGEKAAKALTHAFFDGMNSEPYTVTLKAVKSIYVDGVTYLRAVQCVDSYEIEDAVIIAAVEKDKPLYISGRLFFAESYYDYKTDALDSINILFEIEPENSTIEKMDLIYASVFDDNDAVYLTPSYRFIYSDGTKKIYDATSGAKRFS